MAAAAGAAAGAQAGASGASTLATPPVGNPQGVDESWIDALHVPAAFLCGARDTMGLPRVRKDFAAAPLSVPLFFGLLDGVGHPDEFEQPNGGRWAVSSWRGCAGSSPTTRASRSRSPVQTASSAPTIGRR